MKGTAYRQPLSLLFPCLLAPQAPGLLLPAELCSGSSRSLTEATVSVLQEQRALLASSDPLSLPRKLVLDGGGGWGGSIPERGAPGLSAGGVRGSPAFTCTMLYVKALLPDLYHTAQLPPRVIVPTTRQACPTGNSAPTLSTW